MKKVVLILFVVLFLVSPAESAYEGTLVIPSIELYKTLEYIPLIDRQYDLTELGYGVARLEDTSWNDPLWGRTVIVGHTPGGFENLTNVNIGDIITIITDLYVMEYVVYNITIVSADADPKEWFMPTDTPTLLLQTCYGDDRLMVEAYLENYYE